MVEFGQSSLIKEAKRILFANSVYWKVRDEEGDFMNLLYDKPEEKRGLLSSLIMFFTFWWLIAMLWSWSVKKSIKKQITLTDIWWKLEINWDLEYVKIAYKTLKKNIWDKIAESWWVELVKKKDKFNKILLIILVVLLFILYSLNNPWNNVIRTPTEVTDNSPEGKIKNICKEEINKKISFTNPQFSFHQVQNTFQKWREKLVTWIVKNSLTQQNFACYFDKEDKMVEAKLVN